MTSAAALPALCGCFGKQKGRAIVDQPLISIIIPVYKVEAFLPRCLDSILKQTYSELEIICVNDGSPDNCLSILESYAAKDPRIKVIDQRNQGVAAARNNGLLAATGDVISYIDSDDWIHPQYYEILVDCLLHNDADIVFCEGIKVLEGEEREFPLKGERSRQISMDEAFSLWTVRHCVWGRLYRREVLNGHSFSADIRIGDDTMFNLDVLCHIKNPKLYYIPEDLYYWFMRADSITHTPPPGGVFGEAEWYSRHMDEEEITGSEHLLLEQAIKACLSARFTESYSLDAEAYRNKTNALLKVFIPKLWQSEYVPLRKKLLLDVMSRFPWLYKAFRLAQDPSLRNWKKASKQA